MMSCNKVSSHNQKINFITNNCDSNIYLYKVKTTEDTYYTNIFHHTSFDEKPQIDSN